MNEKLMSYEKSVAIIHRLLTVVVLISLLTVVGLENYRINSDDPSKTVAAFAWVMWAIGVISFVLFVCFVCRDNCNFCTKTNPPKVEQFQGESVDLLPDDGVNSDGRKSDGGECRNFCMVVLEMISFFAALITVVLTSVERNNRDNCIS